MATEISSLYATLSLRDTMTSALNTARSGLNGFADGLQRTGASITSFGGQMSLLTAPLVGFGITSINVAADFESSMAEIQARTGATADEMERLRQTSIQLGADTMFSAQEANDAFLQLLATGMTMDEAFAAIEPIMTGAMAAGGNLADTTSAVTATLMGFGMEADEAARVVNVMAQAAGASAATMEDMGLALADVSGVAEVFGLSFEETSAALAIFSNANIAGAEAGTALRSMLRMMYSDTEPVNQALADLGVSLYDAEGNARPFSLVLEEIDTALEGMNAEDQTRIMNDLAGSYGLAGFSALMAADGLDGMLASMAESTDVGTMADTMMNTFTGTMDSLGGSIEGLQTNAFTPFMQEVLRPLAAQAIEIVNTMSAWAADNPELTTTIIGITAAAAAFFAAMIPLGMIISAVGAGMAALGGLISLPLIAIVALGAAFATNFMGIRDIVQPIIDTITTSVSGFFTALDNGLTPIQAFVSAIQLAFGVETAGSVSTFITNVQELLGAMGTFIIDNVIPVVSDFAAGLIDLWTDIQPGLQSLADWFITDALPLVVSFIEDIAVPAFELITGILGDIWTAIEPALTSFFNWFMSDGLPAISDFISLVVFPIVEDFIALVAGIWEVVSIGLTAFQEWWESDQLTSAIGGVTDVITAFQTVGAGLWDAISTSLQSIYDWFAATFPGIIQFIQPVIDEINRIVAAAITAVNQIVAIGQAILGTNSTANQFANDASTFDGNYSNVGNETSRFDGGFGGGGSFGGGQAYGGKVSAGTSYVVGEQGQETFTPSVDGYITPNDQTGGGITVIFNGGQAPRDQAEADNAAFMLTNSLRARGVTIG